MTASVEFLQEANGSQGESFAALNRFVTTSNAEGLAFPPRLLPTDAETAVRTALQTATAEIVLIPAVRECGSLLATQLPSRWRVLLSNPDQTAIIALRKEILDRLGGLNAVAAPLWELIHRAATGDQPIQFVEPDRELPELDAASLPALVPATPSAEWNWLRHAIAELALPPTVASAPDAAALRAGVFQLHDFLDESHQVSQSIEGRGRHRAGDYWHAIMHRREPDYGNSKYWFRHVGPHPAFVPLARQAKAILDACDSPAAAKWRQRLRLPGDWEPFAFVDLCEQCAAGNDPALDKAARRIQLAEMHLLLESTCRDAETPSAAEVD